MYVYYGGVVADSGVAVIDKRRKPKGANSLTTFPELIPHVCETPDGHTDYPTIAQYLPHVPFDVSNKLYVVR